MDEDRPAYNLKAPGASGHSVHLPGRGSFPPVDEHLVEPEVTRDEIIEGRRVVAMPALAPHADQHGELQFVLRAHVAPGYLAAVDLLTRFALKSDFASDVCVRRAGIDPQTGTRYLEEVVFEIVSEQNERDVTEKAPQIAPARRAADLCALRQGRTAGLRVVSRKPKLAPFGPCLVDRGSLFGEADGGGRSARCGGG